MESDSDKAFSRPPAQMRAEPIWIFKDFYYKKCQYR